ncbi:hypothetical protein AM571_PC01931 (plasmid) [Rhizobium etli 8C-3]|uniref:Uncharacterized protein n=1 Tax=Rhizobium etli 8C-3 TaxID=538025 RepID=A0A1L5PHN8_RHIET|nr:hypothetical protein AM571_PC01931 [Rhizobium etli 8C-3]
MVVVVFVIVERTARVEPHALRQPAERAKRLAGSRIDLGLLTSFERVERKLRC